MEFINWVYVALSTGGALVGWMLGNAMKGRVLNRLIERAFQEGLLTGLDLAQKMVGEHIEGMTPPEDYEKEMMD